MIDVDRERLEQRVLLLTPTGKDATLAESVLHRAGISCQRCPDLTHVCQELERGAGVVLMVEEAISPNGHSGLTEWLHRQPPWSDLPILILARAGADSAAVAKSMDLLGNVTVMERPISLAGLVSTVRSALRARQRQYQTRAHLLLMERDKLAFRDTDRRKDEFLAVLAHELRNPLAPMRNSLHILRMTADQDPTVMRVGEMMDRQVNHMVRLVDDLMEVSRITRGKIELRKEVVEVAAFVRSAIETSRPLIEAGGHELATSIPYEPLWMEGDPVRLTQVIANLLNNAAKYTDVGGRIWLAVNHEDGSVTISVRDNGMGITPDMLPRVFDLFTQVDRHTGRAQGGLGIGLTLVKSLVEMHGGSIEARSEGEGRGSEFVVRLPLSPVQQPAEATPPRNGSHSSLPRHRVLVADDNRDAADSLGTLLKLLGADVHVVYGGAEAMEAFATVRPSVVFLDIGMPQIDGYEVARRMRQDAGPRKVTLIALTGWGQKRDRLRSQAAGFDYHLIKPAEVVALERILRSLDAERPLHKKAT